MMQLNEIQKRTLIPDALINYIQEKQTSQAQVARASKVGEAFVSKIINRETKIGETPIKDKYYLSLAGFIGLKLSRETWRHFNTQNFIEIINQIKSIRAEKGRGTIDADTGAGKSYTCELYQKRFPQNTFIVKCYADENSKEFAINIAEAVGEETYGTAGSITKRVCNKLLKLDNALLIIDEAEHIKNKSGYINIIKSIADRLENKVPFILCGMDINEILQRASDKHKQNFRQTARRFSKRIKCEQDISDDVVKIATELGLNTPSAKWLSARIRNYEDLKTIITAAITESEKSTEPITVQLLNSLYQ
ncbi:hypothetical protein ATE49_11030 [Elizabethkingia miricola]|uniref:DNA transposition AAA+ family ATPase n=1 Tax=Elizabethkingia miricola TaxID=172045 RepID=A0ABY3NC50_ELIMR|nr:ATP-binding protein [Elizabethkingia miricola]MCT4238441.1 ATP-binding protein [Elizabethkingia anophelis]OBS11446.1 hypothetical protein ATE49_11030 [Elizabethkingia miricola]TYO88126.1 DNA transposition AAA+ family ATPase [Elizabethkingia miricola]TYO88742.1 DNA transposition AAA+ family ATPase [Elizabethkingia miricola]